MMDDKATFVRYVDDNVLPVRDIEVREIAGATLALASHAPSLGVSYDPIEDLIVSVVLASCHSSVVRDVGFGRQAFTEGPGCILVTPPRQASYWYFEGTPLVLHLSVPQDRIASLLASLGHSTEGQALHGLACRPLYDPLVAQLASRVWATGPATDPASQAVSRHGLDTLLAILCRFAVEEEADTAAGARRSALSPWRLKRVTAFVEARLTQGVTVEEMARCVDLSTDHFVRSFAAATGRTPHQWVTEVRMERAKAMLRDPRRSTTEIALELGYSSPAHFSSRFRQVVGVSPTTWRRMFAQPTPPSG